VLAFSSDRAGAVSIYVMNPEGEEVKRLTTVGDGAPLWSPDGDHILFWTGRGLSGGAQEVWVMTKTGADQRRLTDFNGSTCWPSCEP
jgi:Tol biopolymer transport system component